MLRFPVRPEKDVLYDIETGFKSSRFSRNYVPDGDFRGSWDLTDICLKT
jgi:hypothetical protein